MFNNYNFCLNYINDWLLLNVVRTVLVEQFIIKLLKLFEVELSQLMIITIIRNFVKNNTEINTNILCAYTHITLYVYHICKVLCRFYSNIFLDISYFNLSSDVLTILNRFYRACKKDAACNGITVYSCSYSMSKVSDT